MTLVDNLKDLLEGEFPCDVCIIKTMCSKSAVEGSMCDEVKKLIIERLINKNYKRKEETK